MLNSVSEIKKSISLIDGLISKAEITDLREYKQGAGYTPQQRDRVKKLMEHHQQQYLHHDKKFMEVLNSHPGPGIPREAKMHQIIGRAHIKAATAYEKYHSQREQGHHDVPMPQFDHNAMESVAVIAPKKFGERRNVAAYDSPTQAKQRELKKIYKELDKSVLFVDELIKSSRAYMSTLLKRHQLSLAENAKSSEDWKELAKLHSRYSDDHLKQATNYADNKKLSRRHFRSHIDHATASEHIHDFLNKRPTSTSSVHARDPNYGIGSLKSREQVEAGSRLAFMSTHRTNKVENPHHPNFENHEAKLETTIGKSLEIIEGLLIRSRIEHV